MDPSSSLFVIVSGPPGSGKTTLAKAIALELGLPLIAKDTIKEALMSVLPIPDVEASREIGRASMATLFAVAGLAPNGAVLESNFDWSRAAPELRRLPGRLLEVFCRCDRSVALARYMARSGSRHTGHFDSVRTAEELWSDSVSQPVAGGWPVLEVSTNSAVDVAAVVRDLRHAALMD